MHKIIYILILCVLSSCQRSDQLKRWESIKDSHSIHEYQSYLIDNINTKYLIQIVDSLKTFWKEDKRSWNLHFPAYKIYLERDGKLITENGSTKKDTIIIEIIYYLANPNNDYNLPEKRPINIPGLGTETFMQSVGNIALITKGEYKEEKYRNAVSLLCKSIDQMRNDASNLFFDKSYQKLSQKRKILIDQLYPYKFCIELYEPKPDEPWPENMPIIL